MGIFALFCSVLTTPNVPLCSECVLSSLTKHNCWGILSGFCNKHKPSSDLRGINPLWWVIAVTCVIFLIKLGWFHPAHLSSILWYAGNMWQFFFKQTAAKIDLFLSSARGNTESTHMSKKIPFESNIKNLLKSIGRWITHRFTYKEKKCFWFLLGSVLSEGWYDPPSEKIYLWMRIWWIIE